MNQQTKFTIDDDEQKSNESDEKSSRLYQIYEKLGDGYCNLGLYDQGLKSYLEQVNSYLIS